MRFSKSLAVVVGLTCGAAAAQDADLTIHIEGDLFELGGLVEILARPDADAVTTPQDVTLSDRFARITLPYPETGRYNFRFRPGPDSATREGSDGMLTRRETIGTR